ncbi:MAG: dipeptidyl aminopeptidase/acylaminoacyl peptidase [Pseudohongiellaceae bacterium]|jgi:dipeptidyl aminopeptidase/acylaminoacyl peptidase
MATQAQSTRRSARAKKRPITIEDLQRLAMVASPAISPEGTRIAYVVKQAGDTNNMLSNLWIADGIDGDCRQFTSGNKDSQPAWSPDGRILAFVSRRDQHCDQIALIEADGGEAITLTDFPEGDIANFAWAPDGISLAVSFRATAPEWTSSAVAARKDSGECDPPRVIDDPFYRLDGDGYFDSQRFQLFQIDVSSGERSMLWGKDRLGFFSYSFSPDAKKLALIVNRHKNSFAQDWTCELLTLDIKSGKLKELPNIPVGRKSSVAWSPDGKQLAWAGVDDPEGKLGTNNVCLWVCDAKTGGARNLTGREDYCLSAPTLADVTEIDFNAQLRWHPDSKRLWVQIGWHGETHLASIAARGGQLSFHTKGRRQVRMGNLSDDGRTIALTVESLTRPAEVHVANIPKLKSTSADDVQLETMAISDVNGELMKELELATAKTTWVKSADGTKVQVWTMIPPGASERRKRPTLLSIHGGPQTQYGWAFFHEFQLMAAAGYAVVFSNPRGSKGYGQALCSGNRHSWGVKDWADVEAVKDWMRDQAFCDSTRMGIMGGSFGGYMTLWAIGHSNDFRAAISDRCVSNMVSMWGSSDVNIWPDSEFPGNTWDNTKALWDMSPLKHLGKCKTPTLLIHSEGDLRCNVAESEQVHSALALRGVPVRFVRYPKNTSHGMSRGGPLDMRAHRLGQMLAWWKRWMSKK